jgi:lipoprotein signal peptidase
MLALLTTLLTVPIADQLIKCWLRRSLGAGSISLGPIGAVRLVDSQIWLSRGSVRRGPGVLWTFWLVGALVLVGVTLWCPACGLSAGLLLGGAASHAFESTQRGGVCDYICLRFWPAFNLADVAITVGGLGIAATALFMTATGGSVVSLP